MGIINVTPDSFSDGGAHLRAEDAVAHGLRLLDEGADIIDIGGESTRPPGSDYGAGSASVPADEEMARVIPVIEGLRAARPGVVISIDTVKPAVAERAVEAGATIINDVSAGSFDAAIWEVAARHDVPYIVMHGHDPHNRTRADAVSYGNVVEEVFAFLRERIDAARRAGVRDLIADVGIGFSKGAADNITLLREHRRFLDLGVPLLVGASRKSFIGRLLGGAPPEERLIGTLAAHAVATLNGASILRVHDVREAREFFRVFEALGKS
jgi:dihydropteroate synthase